VPGLPPGRTSRPGRSRVKNTPRSRAGFDGRGKGPSRTLRSAPLRYVETRPGRPGARASRTGPAKVRSAGQGGRPSRKKLPTRWALLAGSTFRSKPTGASGGGPRNAESRRPSCRLHRSGRGPASAPGCTRRASRGRRLRGSTLTNRRMPCRRRMASEPETRCASPAPGEAKMKHKAGRRLVPRRVGVFASDRPGRVGERPRRGCAARRSAGRRPPMAHGPPLCDARPDPR